MSNWLVLLVTAVGGGVLATLLRIGHERGAEIRSRMLDAAEDFVMTLTRAHDEAGRAVWPVMRAGIVRNAGAAAASDQSPEAEEAAAAACATANAMWSEADARVPRIALLFDVDSPATAAARRASNAMGGAVVLLTSTRATLGFEEEGQDFDAAFEDAIDDLNSRAENALRELDDFSRAAHDAIVGWHRFLSRPPRRGRHAELVTTATPSPVAHNVAPPVQTR